MAKIIAFHLPQFHSIPENDKWWGEGYTEWTLLKKAEPMFKGHYQPREPLSYYNMLDAKAREAQAAAAKKYGIYGFCYYHYWFNGKLLLEKPAELILEQKEPDFPFCFCWANEPWKKTWTNEEKIVLMPQEYGTRSDWARHIDYLLPFFKDERYIKIDGRPVFVFYYAKNIPPVDEMIDFFDERCRESGLSGIFAVEELNYYQSEASAERTRAVIEFEPMYTINHSLASAEKAKSLLKRALRKLFYIPALTHFHDYDTIWQRITQRKQIIEGKQVWLGAMTDWDNSPRKKRDAVIFKGASPQKFKKYLKEQIIKANAESGFIFINAWNEWTEGAYLEPDKRYGYAYLKAVKEALEETKEE